MSFITKRAYAEMFGPTVGDRLRLADTALIAEVDKTLTMARTKPTAFHFLYQPIFHLRPHCKIFLKKSTKSSRAMLMKFRKFWLGSSATMGTITLLDLDAPVYS